MEIILLCLIGFVGGLASGFFGIGGAVLIVPALTGLLGYSQKMAQGTTLVMFLIAPSMFAAFQYFKAGNAVVKTAGILWVGVFIGSAIGAWVVNVLFKDSVLFMIILKRSFAVVMMMIAIQTWIKV